MAKLKGGTRIYGDIKIDGGIYDSSNNVGIAGSILSSTGAGVSWTTPGVRVLYNNINIGEGIKTLNFAGTGISSVTANISGISTITVDLQSNLDGGTPTTNYGGIEEIDGGSI